MAAANPTTTEAYKLPVYLYHRGYFPRNTLGAAKSYSDGRQQKIKAMNLPPISKTEESREEIENLFDKPITSVIQSEFETYLKEHAITCSSAYTLSNRTFTIIKSTAPQTSGSTAAMMIALDQIQKRKIIVNVSSSTEQQSDKQSPTKKELISEDFLRWVIDGETKNGHDLKDHLKNEGFNPVLVYFFSNLASIDPSDESDNIYFYDRMEIIHRISAIIEDTGNSVIIAINPKIISSHWIIIDEICLDPSNGQTYTYVRDSYSGKAYRIASDDLLTAFDENSGKVEAVYIQPPL
jgi:hypothetical protein